MRQKHVVGLCITMFCLIALIGVVSAGTYLIYIENTAQDGTLEEGDDGTFYEVRNGAGTMNLTTDTQIYHTEYAAATPGIYTGADVGAFIFNTSVIPDNETVVNATLRLWGYADKYDLGAMSSSLTLFSPASYTGISTGDYDSFSNDRISDNLTTWSKTGYNNFTIINFSAINIHGYTPIMHRDSWHIDNTTVGLTWVANKYSYRTCYDTSYAGTSRDPYLVVYTILTPLPPSNGTVITQPAAGITSKCLNLSATNATTPTWWRYSSKSGNLVWQTDNVSAVGGVANITECGLPLMSNTRFYFAACDNNGCADEQSAVLAQVTPIGQTTFGSAAQNISDSHLDIGVVGASVVEPYQWSTGNMSIVIGTLLFFLFTGIWISHRETLVPVMLGMLGAGLLLYEGTNSVGIPPEMLIVVIGLVSAALAGVVTSLFKR